MPLSARRRTALVASLSAGILAATITLASGSAALAAEPAAPAPASAPVSVIPNGSGASGTAGLNYVALGDSYSAGYGLTPYSDKPAVGCYQADENYPHRLAAALNLNLTDVTCSGAVTANIIDTPQVTTQGEPPAPVQSDALSASTNIVTVTIGGNDFGFGPMAATCLALSATGPTLSTYANCKAFYDFYGKDYLSTKIVDVVQPAVKRAFELIHQKAPNAKIFVIGYPAIAPDAAHIPATGCFTSVLGTGQPPFPQNAYPFTDIDVPYLHDLEAQLDSVIHTEAEAIGATFVPLFDQTVGNSPCASNPASYINGLTIQDDPNAPGVPAVMPDGQPVAAPNGSPISLKLGALHPNEAGVSFIESKVQAAVTAAFPPAGTVPIGRVVPATDPPANTVPMLAESGSDPVSWIWLAAFAMLSGAWVLVFMQRRAARKQAMSRPSASDVVAQS